MRREAEATLEGRLEEANHLWHLNNVGSEKVRVPNPNTKGRPVERGEIMSKRGLDPTRAHNFGILNSHPQVDQAARIPNLTDLTLAFSMRRRGTPKGTRSTTRTGRPDPPPICPKSYPLIELPHMCRPKGRLGLEEVRMIEQVKGKANE